MTEDTNIEAILRERGSRYGPFDGHAKVTQGIEKIIRDGLEANLSFVVLEEVDKAVILEGLHMVAHKIGRIVNGDPLYKDSWDDIEGYAKLVSRHISTLPPF